MVEENRYKSISSIAKKDALSSSSNHRRNKDALSSSSHRKKSYLKGSVNRGESDDRKSQIKSSLFASLGGDDDGDDDCIYMSTSLKSSSSHQSTKSKRKKAKGLFNADETKESLSSSFSGGMSSSKKRNTPKRHNSCDGTKSMMAGLSRDSSKTKKNKPKRHHSMSDGTLSLNDTIGGGSSHSTGRLGRRRGRKEDIMLASGNDSFGNLSVDSKSSQKSTKGRRKSITRKIMSKGAKGIGKVTGISKETKASIKEANEILKGSNKHYDYIPKDESDDDDDDSSISIDEFGGDDSDDDDDDDDSVATSRSTGIIQFGLSFLEKAYDEINA